MSKNIILAVLVFSFFSCNSKLNIQNPGLEKDKNYPQWLQANGYSPKQTSGIAFISSDSLGDHFLLSDDVGKIHHLIINSNKIVSIKEVVLSENVEEYFSVFPKKDFEEITYDKAGNVYLSVEGNFPAPGKFTSIFKLNFAGSNILSDTVSSVTRLEIKPESLFQKYLANNIGYEGLAADDKYLYLGLEGFSESGIFADSTVIFILDKNTFKIVKEVNTAGRGIGTICGLYSDSSRSLLGIDRNGKKIFHIRFNDNFDIEEISLEDVKTNIPSFPSFNYVASLESITMDNQKNIYLIDDPWPSFFIPPADILKQLDTLSVQNFRNLVPIIYKFKIKN